MDSPQILSIQILILSWPWALLGSTSRIILAISLLLNDIDETILSILFKNVEGSLLELFIKDHCSAKKEFNFSAFSLKSVTHLFWCCEGGIQGIFYYLKPSSELTNRISSWSLDQPTFLISGSSIFLLLSIIESWSFRRHLAFSNIFGSLFLLTYFL